MALLKNWLAGAVSVLVVFIFALPAHAEDFAVSNVAQEVVSADTWSFLDERSTSGWGIVARSLGGRPIEPSLEDTVHASLRKGLEEGFSSITQFERTLLSLIKLEENPSNYMRKDLLSLLAGDNYLYHEGLNGASTALLVYQACAYYGTEVNASLRNSPASLIDHIISSQQQQGGFAISAGRKPDAGVTALALTSLAPYRETHYVSAAIDKGISWLSSQQNPDGSFSNAEGMEDCEITAAVLVAIRSCGIAADDPRFVKNEITLLAGLQGFLNADGSYSLNYESGPSTSATEQAVIALYANFYGMSPYLHPATYPGYVPPAPPTEQPISAKTSMFLFFGKFLLMLGVIYLLLMITIRIGRYGEKKKLPGSLALERKKRLQAEADAPLDFNIPMKAQLPDFDKMEEKDTGLQDSAQKNTKG